MAAPCWHVGHHIRRNAQSLRVNIEHLAGNRAFGWTPAVHQQAKESVILPRKKAWSKEAVLETLASTLNRDSTAYPYQFQDDPYLSPRTATEFKLYSLAQDSGRSAARYFVNNHPKFFTKDFAEPHIPCLMPETVSLLLEEVSEEALKERITLRKVTAAVDMYDQLLQTGTAVSMETTHELLDLICLYCDRNPVQEGEAGAEEVSGWRISSGAAAELSWTENNNAERIFYLLPERDTRCYSAVIRGMVKHGAYAKAFSVYSDMLNNRTPGDVHIFNALISAAPEVRDGYSERWDLISELLNHMKQQEIHPNLLTFNSVLKSLRQCGSLARSYSPQTLNEMKALGIGNDEPACRTVPPPGLMGVGVDNSDVLQNLMTELEGQSFTCVDPDDGESVCCLDNKDLELGYRVQSLVEVGENWRLLGDSVQLSIYYGRFFNLLCMMEDVDVVLRWYKQMVPSLYYPNAQGMKHLLQALDTDGRLDLLPDIWTDMKTLGLYNRADLLEQLLGLMAGEEHSPELQEAFAVCALDVKSVFEEKAGLEWSASSLSHVTTLLLRASKAQQAWDMLKLFKAHNRIPSEALLNSFLSVCQRDGASERAVELVQLSAAFCLTSTSGLASRALAEFDLNQEQR
uniref:Small ribosomal subunit protein mS39 n=1 Tax=Nothobranchius furzeri TaxID=105023 RepID=A0A8C6K5T6_NOTFU